MDFAHWFCGEGCVDHKLLERPCVDHNKPSYVPRPCELLHDRVTLPAFLLMQLRDCLDNSYASFAVPCLTPRDTNSEAGAGFYTVFFFFCLSCFFLHAAECSSMGRRRPQHSSRSGLIPAADSRMLPRWRGERGGRNCCQEKKTFLTSPLLCRSAATSRLPAMRFSSSLTSIVRA